MSELWAQALTQACHSYTHTLLGGVEEHVPGPNGPPVKLQENTALLSDCGLTGTPLPVFLSGLGGKECSVCVHSVYDDVVGLSSPVLAEAQFDDCVICAAWFSAAANCTNSPLPAHLKAKADELDKWPRNQASLHVLYASQADL